MAKYICQLRRGTKDDWTKYEESKYIQATGYSSGITYYSDKNGTVASPQPTTSSEVKNGNYYIKNPQYLVPQSGELVLEYDNGIPRLKIGDGVTDCSALPYMSIDSFVLPTPTTINLYHEDWQEVKDEEGKIIEGRHTQDITGQLKGKITENSKIDLQPTPEQLYAFYEKDVAFTTVNEGGTVRVCAIGTKPTKDYTDIQVTIMEVAMDG